MNIRPYLLLLWAHQVIAGLRRKRTASHDFSVINWPDQIAVRRNYKNETKGLPYRIFHMGLYVSLNEALLCINIIAPSSTLHDIDNSLESLKEKRSSINRSNKFLIRLHYTELIFIFEIHILEAWTNLLIRQYRSLHRLQFFNLI